MAKQSKSVHELDRFDSLKPTTRVGAHRNKPTIGSGKTRVLFAFLATLILTTVGVIFIQLQPSSIKYSEQDTAPAATPVKSTVPAVLDPTAEVIVLNGTEVSDLAYFVDDLITENEWGTVSFSGDAEKTDIKISAVFYGDPAFEAAALALAEKLDGMSAYLNTDYMSMGGDLTILLGSDYRGPGYEEALNGEHPRAGEALSLNPEGNNQEGEEFYEEPYSEGEWQEYQPEEVWAE